MKSKYGAKRVLVDGIKFSSKLEASYYSYLKSLGIKFELQPSFVLLEWFTDRFGNKHRPIKYDWDFSFYEGDQLVVIDTKWMATDLAKVKRKMFIKKFDDIELRWLIKYWGLWVDYFGNEKRKKVNRRNILWR